MQIKSRYCLGGPMKEGFVYAKRKKEYKTMARIISENCFINIIGPRQTGKSSFVKFSLREIYKSLNNEFYEIKLDLRHSLGNPDDQNIHKHEKNFFNKIIFAVGKKISLTNSEIDEWIDSRSQHETNTDLLMSFLIEKIYPAANGKKIILIFDELDKVLKWGNYRDSFIEFLVLLGERLDEFNLSLITISVSSPSFLFSALSQGDFRVGLPLRISDFNFDDDDVINDWVDGLDHITDKGTKIKIGKYVLEYTGGQPRLASRIFDYAVRNNISDIPKLLRYIEDEIVRNAFTVNTQDYEYFKIPEEFITYKEEFSSQALKIWSDLLDGETKIQSANKSLHVVLLGSGLISTHQGDYLSIRNKIFQKVYNKTWIEDLKSKINENELSGKYSDKADSTKIKEVSRIAIINLGGTIGMIEKNSVVIQPTRDDFYTMYPFLDEVVDFKYMPYEKITDGANVYPEDWEKIAQMIFDNRNNGYSGFIIMHGTDTLSYTASALAFALGENLSFPVVFVGSQAVHNAYHGDAQPNLARAVKVASMNIPELVIVFGDNIYRAVRTEKSSDYLFQGFSSNTQSPLGIITEKVEINTSLIRKHPTSSSEGLSKEILKQQYDIQLRNRFETNILKINQVPGLSVAWYLKLLDEFEIKGILIESLGLGNLPHLSGNRVDRKYNLIPLIEEANKKYVPVIITSKFPIKPDFVNKYKPAKSVIDAGGIWAGNLTSIATQTKLMWLLPQLESFDKQKNFKTYLKTLKELLLKDFVGEIDDIKIN